MPFLSLALIANVNDVLSYATQAKLRFVDSPVWRRIGTNAFWSLLGNGAGQALAMIAAVVAARMLGAQLYGKFSLVLSTVNLFSVLAVVGLGVMATKHIAQYRMSDPAKAGRIVRLSSAVAFCSGLLVAGSLLIGAPFLSNHILRAPQLSFALRLGAFLLLFAAINAAQTGILAGFEAFREIAVANAARGILTIVAVYIFIPRSSVNGAVIGYGIVAILVCFIYNVLVTRQCQRLFIPLGRSSWRAELPLLWTFSIPVLVAGFSFTPAAWWCTAMLAAKVGYRQVGIFTAANQIQNAIAFVSASISAVALPMFSNAVPERNFLKYRNLFILNTVATTVAVSMIAVPIALFAPILIRIYGHGFEDGVLAVRLFCVFSIVSALNSSVGHVLWSLNAVTAGMGLAVIRSLVLLLAATFLVDKGAPGLAASYVVMAVVQLITELAFVRHLLLKYKRLWHHELYECVGNC